MLRSSFSTASKLETHVRTAGDRHDLARHHRSQPRAQGKRMKLVRRRRRRARGPVRGAAGGRIHPARHGGLRRGIWAKKARSRFPRRAVRCSSAPTARSISAARSSPAPVPGLRAEAVRYLPRRQKRRRVAAAGRAATAAPASLQLPNRSLRPKRYRWRSGLSPRRPCGALLRRAAQDRPRAPARTGPDRARGRGDARCSRNSAS